MRKKESKFRSKLRFALLSADDSPVSKFLENKMRTSDVYHEQISATNAYPFSS
jgi:hypothetical protein